MNFYAFGLNNPANYVDPNGRRTWVPCAPPDEKSVAKIVDHG